MVGGTCPSTANVDVTLQAYYCNSYTGCAWRAVGFGSKDVAPGGGRGNRATAKEPCKSTNILVSYRGYVDVDLNGVIDPSGTTLGSSRGLYCYPSS